MVPVVVFRAIFKSDHSSLTPIGEVVGNARRV
jgi:hypothetical protein